MAGPARFPKDTSQPPKHPKGSGSTSPEAAASPPPPRRRQHPKDTGPQHRPCRSPSPLWLLTAGSGGGEGPSQPPAPASSTGPPAAPSLRHRCLLCAGAPGALLSPSPSPQQGCGGTWACGAPQRCPRHLHLPPSNPASPRLGTVASILRCPGFLGKDPSGFCLPRQRLPGKAPACPQLELSGAAAAGAGYRGAQGNAAGSCSKGQTGAPGAGALLPAPGQPHLTPALSGQPSFPSTLLFGQFLGEQGGRGLGTGARCVYLHQWERGKGAPTPQYPTLGTLALPLSPKRTELFNISSRGSATTSSSSSILTPRGCIQIYFAAANKVSGSFDWCWSSTQKARHLCKPW